MLNTNKLYNMDCIDFLKKIDNETIDLIITSPPYNCGIEYDNYSDNLKWNDYLEWCEKWLVECKRVLKNDGRMCINHYLNFHLKQGKSYFPLFDIKYIQDKIKLNPHKLIIWPDKTMKRMTAWGSWKSASAPNIQTPTEGILISYKKQWKKINKGESTITGDEFVKSVIGIWDNLKPDTKSLTKCTFPIELPKKLINLLSYKNDLILDPFIGSGTTAIAAIETNRNYIGSELSKNYTNIANKRIEDYHKKIENNNIHKNFF